MNNADGQPEAPAPRLLITAGPTHEPIDAVRFLGNRSSGALGLALAADADRRRWPRTLLLGPTNLPPPRDPPPHPGNRADTTAPLFRFRTTADLDALLAEHLHRCDILIMAAAVADYRPAQTTNTDRKLRRTPGPMTLELEPTPDLLARCAGRRAPGQLLVGFALEPEGELHVSARRKLERKGVDAIVANPLETMDAATITATLYHAGRPDPEPAPAGLSKADFAPWLLDRLHARWLAGRPAA